MRDTTSGRVRRVAAAILRILVSAFVIFPVSAWSALALWFRLPAPEGVRALAAGLFVVLGLAAIAALFLRRSLIGLAVFALVFGGVLIWWSTIKPPTDGDWAPDVARQTTGTIEGDILTLSDVRDFDWRADEDFTERWSKRSYDLSKLKTLDLFLAYWAGPQMAHVLMSFGFENGDYLTWSVEVRREKSGEFSPIADAFKSHTLIYLATTERDFGALALECARRGRAALPAQHAARERARAPARICLTIERRWPRSPSGTTRSPPIAPPSCSRSFARPGARIPLDWRLVVNGFLPGYLYDHRGGGHDNAAQRIDGARAHQRPGEGGRSVAGLLAGDPRRRAVALGRDGEIGSKPNRHR